MNKTLVADNDTISVWVYPERKMIHHVMKDLCFGANFRDGLTRGVEAMKQHGATKWLSDDRLHGQVPPEDARWATDIWVPMAKAAGWRHWAVVQPHKNMAQVNMARFVKLYGDLGINAQMFSDLDEATAWLDEQ